MSESDSNTDNQLTKLATKPAVPANAKPEVASDASVSSGDDSDQDSDDSDNAEKGTTGHPANKAANSKAEEAKVSNWSFFT